MASDLNFNCSSVTHIIKNILISSQHSVSVVKNPPVYVRLRSGLVRVQCRQLLLETLVQSDPSTPCILRIVCTIQIDRVAVQLLWVILLKGPTKRLSSALLSWFFATDQGGPVCLSVFPVDLIVSLGSDIIGSSLFFSSLFILTPILNRLLTDNFTLLFFPVLDWVVD